MVRASLFIVFLVSTRVVKVQVPLDSKMCRYMGGTTYIYIYMALYPLEAPLKESSKDPSMGPIGLSLRPRVKASFG